MPSSPLQPCRTCVCIAVCCVMVTPAHAAPGGKATTASITEAEAYAERAVERFKAKDFEVAAKLFMQAYARSHSPALVFNAARAYEEAGKSGDASSLFKLYITISDDADGIVNARERIKRLEGKPESKPPPGSEVPQPQVGPAKPSTAKQPVTIEANALPDKPAPDKTLAWTATGLAGATVAGGIALLAVGASNSAAANDLRVHDEAGVRDYAARYDHAQLQWNAGIGVLAAGVALGGWAAWLHLRAPAGATKATVALTPTVRGLQLAVGF